MCKTTQHRNKSKSHKTKGKTEKRNWVTNKSSDNKLKVYKHSRGLEKDNN